ncbi:MAG: hypothetical protein ONB33_09645 [candidate division KSB1 bacterium]|nr:hypothetical protein [candidate division KSB1 bacterium]MDZ7357856.1 hypothetical protein [candidate division KSB1 bacterium]MDZ7400838.1 hypothetical protein [candidate division KSB1 bacterium]
MKKFTLLIFILLFLQWSLVTSVLAQGKKYEGPDDPAGDIAAEREGYMTGNRVFLYFRNTTELSDWPKVEVSKWPNTYDGVKMLDGIGLLIGARVYITNNTTPVTDRALITSLAAQGKIDTLYFLQTSYREEMDVDPTGTVEWGLYPVFGYFNELSEYPAMSNRPSSWPPEGWPYKDHLLHWPGEWDGRFGRGVIYADLETYFVANDAQDQEYLGPEDRVKYYPRPGRKIGDIRPATIQNGLPWGGIGIRVEQRGFQWNNPQARDAIFWEYTIANISDYDLLDVAFGYWVDNAIGDAIAGAGDDDELGYFDTKVDMAYSWDIDGIGQGGFPTGIMGFAYLESPGLAYDGVDNDEDGIIDEKRDNDAVMKIGPKEGYANLKAFLDFYKLTEADLREHWDADEDQDWEDGEDLNGDGVYQLSEFAGDDVGLDGVGPGELNYTGPDEGECNHKPDRVEGIAEPNFAETDVSESDMVGLTSFQLFPIQPHRPPYYRWFRNDKSMWEVIGQKTLVESIEWVSNLVETFASGPFPLYQGRTERISMSELHAYDPLEGLNSKEHSAPALFEVKRIVQIIYEKDYRFAQPPKMPTLTATPADGKVILTWDDIADTRTRDPFVGNVNDFEGYKLFRATDKKMQDAEVITDGFGTPFMKKPIFQCDLKDGRKGFTNFGLINGVGYNLGYDTGITHYFIDENVQNGRTYYYAIVAYDYGAPNIGPGIAPSENNIVIELDESEEVRAIGKNVQIVTPYQSAAGYQPPTITPMEQKLFGSGTVTPEILANKSLKPGHTYKVKFSIDTVYTVPGYDHGLVYATSGIHIYDTDLENALVYEETPAHYAYDNLVRRDTAEYKEWKSYWHFKTNQPVNTDIFDGMRLKIELPVEIAAFDPINSGWVVGNSAIHITPTQKESRFFPWEYDIVFTNKDSAYVGRVSTKTMRDENDLRLSRSDVLTNMPFSFYVVNKMFLDSTGSYERMDLVVHDTKKNGKFDIIGDRVLVGPVTKDNKWAGTAFVIDFFSVQDSTRLPKPGDVYRVTFKRPFFVTDSLTFKVQATETLDLVQLENDMDQIKVVPNPYVATNAMEPAVANFYLNQRRRIMFTHIPAECTIKIFTVSGALVDEIEVNNPADQGIVHWDLLSKEGLEIAAGMYIYHVKSKRTGAEKIGKFAVIK